jgi:methyl-accepting chemotaxis protein-like sensor
MPVVARSVESDAVLDQLSGIGEAVFGDLEDLCAAVLPAFTGSTGRRPGSRELGIEHRVTRLLRDAGDGVVGAGFVAAPGALCDVSHWLEWWTAGGPCGRRWTERLVVQVDAAADDFRDYTTLPWFRVPERTGARHLTGPYVDYLCTDEYTLTFTAPVQHGGRFLGVVGADVVVRWVEDRLREPLRALDAPVTVVNAAGRVLTSTVASLTTGDLVREVPAWWSGGAHAPGGRLLRCPGLPLGLLVHPA